MPYPSHSNVLFFISINFEASPFSTDSEDDDVGRSMLPLDPLEWLAVISGTRGRETSELRHSLQWAEMF